MNSIVTSRRGTPPQRRFTRAARWTLAAAGLALVFVLTFTLGTAVRGRDAAPARQQVAPVAVTLDARIDTLQQRLTNDSSDTRSAIDLSAAYLQKARESGDPAWYGKAAGLLSGVLAREPENAEALAWMGSLALSRHQFADGLEWGRKAMAAEPELLAAYPVLIDAYVELGRYDEAVATSDAFIQLRPDLPSYSRVSYLRELYGDREGAIEAMVAALDAATAGTESAAWTRVQLGNLYFNGGNLDRAEMEYRRTLDGMPGYAPAEAGLARVAASRGDYQRAIELLSGVVERLPLPEYVILLGDVYSAAGDLQSASQQYALVGVEIRLQQANGVNTDLEFALFQADHADLGTAPVAVVTVARQALAERPSIYGHDTLAWALYGAGQYDEARAEIGQALRLGTEDALLFYHAGKIAEALGDDAAARDYLRTALSINPYFSVLHGPDARVTLERLAGER